MTKERRYLSLMGGELWEEDVAELSDDVCQELDTAHGDEMHRHQFLTRASATSLVRAICIGLAEIRDGLTALEPQGGLSNGTLTDAVYQVARILEHFDSRYDLMEAAKRQR